VSALAWMVALLLGALLIVTLLAQLRRVPPVMWLKRYDACALIPAWTFFAPNPGTRDARLLWRQRYTDGRLSPWRETTGPQVTPWKGLWNPTKRVRKGVTDATSSVLRRAVNFPHSQLTVISVPYLLIVNHICALPGAEMANARQFMIAYTDRSNAGREGEPRVQFVSHWHLIEPADAMPTTAVSDPQPVEPTATTA